MDRLKELRNAVGPEAKDWTEAQLEQLSRDIESMATILLDLYRIQKGAEATDTCGSADFDGFQSHR